MQVSDSADVAPSATIAQSAKVWHLAQIREGVRLGVNVVVGRGAYIGPGVEVGDNSKIQNYALVYEPARLGEGVFIGPAAVLTNDHYPRSVNPDLTQKDGQDWESVGVYVGDGASIGARAVCVAPLRIGRWALIAAGAVVTRDVPDFAIVAGVPARQIGWVGPAAHRLVRSEREDGVWICPKTAQRYVETAQGRLIEAAGTEVKSGPKHR